MLMSYRINFIVNDLKKSIERTCKGPLTVQVYGQERGNACVTRAKISCGRNMHGYLFTKRIGTVPVFVESEPFFFFYVNHPLRYSF